MSDILPPIRQFLATTSVPYDVLPCAPELADTAQFCDHYGISLDCSANAILVKSRPDESRFALCVLLAVHRLNTNHTVRRRLDARKISFATPEETREITGMEIGGVTPLALPESLPVWVDANVMHCEYIILGGGNRTSKLKISPRVFEHVPGCEIVAELVKPEPEA